MEGPTTRLILIRHAEVEASYHRIFGGSRIDMRLSHKGHAQADGLAKYLRNHPFEACYCSPMIRAQHTALPLLAGRDVSLVTLPSLREVDFGAWTGYGWAAVHERFGVSAFDWLTELEHGRIPDGDSVSSLRERVEPCLRRIILNCAGKSAAVVCHGGIVRMILSLLTNMPLSKFSSFEVDYASVTVVDCHPRKTEIQLMNFTPWRDLP